MMLHEAPEIFKKVGRTIRQWFEPIIRMWRFTKSNGITEGFHRKMKLIQRSVYGYRNFQNYRFAVSHILTFSFFDALPEKPSFDFAKQHKHSKTYGNIGDISQILNQGVLRGV